ncbi:MAG: glycine cleavage system aminomethyltransferase GcvT, partial [Deltaproteobacteria bacterium]|nr:glycine cleavage system aminomethyltransferase GcvT [Deltaproteobacteria bacterium]
FDVSHMGQFSIRGPGGLEALQGLVTNDLSKIAMGQAQYNVLCNEQGGTLDDIIVYRRSKEHVYICVNASNREKDFEWIRSHLPPAVPLQDESSETALLALQGPKAQTIMNLACDPIVVENLKYYWGCEAKVFERPCFLSRTGYTGEDGFELYLRNQDAAAVWVQLLEAGRKMGLVPCGLGARDTLRLEMGYALYGHELSEKTSPLSAGLSWVVKLNKPTPFIGMRSLEQERKRGSTRVLGSFVIDDRRIARQGYRLMDEKGFILGEITSGTFSPHLNKPIALGFVDSEKANRTDYFAEVREQLVKAIPSKLPFVTSRVKKN